METDYLVLGSGLSALTLSALLAKAGHRVTVVEAHDRAGGYGHTFEEGNQQYQYHFNAQLHYVWDCGEGEVVHRILKKLDLDQTVTFVQYNTDGFDHMYMPGFQLKIPSNYALLAERLFGLFPKDQRAIRAFLTEIKTLAYDANRITKPSGGSTVKHALGSIRKWRLLLYYNRTLQQVFDHFQLPLACQTLLASQWPDFLLPPNQLSFYCWLILFDGYMRGAYYPERHFEQVVNSLVKVITDHGGTFHFDQKVFKFSVENQTITRVFCQNVNDERQISEYTGAHVICNFDPKQAAHMIGLEHFSKRVRAKLHYDYSCSNFVVYAAVKDIDLQNYGFGNWNVFHTDHTDLNQAFYNMYHHCDYSQPAFAITTPSLVTSDPTGCPSGHQILQLLTVANHAIFKHLKFKNSKEYIARKKNIYDAMINTIAKHYVPDIKEHIHFKMLGSPTTNERYCWTPEGNSYGSNMTPANTGLNRLNHFTSLKNFYFCNASSGFAGFTKSLQNGAGLYEHLTQDSVPAYG
jgi:phytoene dehydrogenase-like protein